MSSKFGSKNRSVELESNAFERGPNLGRRRLGKVFAGVLASYGVTSVIRAEELPSDTQCIDVHHHFLPPIFRQIMGDEAIGAPSPNHAVPQWRVEDSLSVMDRQGITSAVVSAPPLWMKDMDKTRRLSRACNDYAAQMVADHPSRFGTFSCLPLPDVAAAIREVKYAFDVLKADGIGLMTNYGGQYLGDDAFSTVFDELNRRKAVVFVHPTSCGCNKGLLPDLPAALIEFPHDTTRAINSLLFSGTFGRCPDIRFIFSHAGGTVPYIAARMAILSSVDQTLSKRVPGGVMPALRRLYYDTALSANPITMAALLKLVPADNVLLGTDFPGGLKSKCNNWSNV